MNFLGIGFTATVMFIYFSVSDVTYPMVYTAVTGIL